MSSKKNDKSKDPEKTADLPPYGSRNPDPVSDQPGSHPVETGIGAILGGVASGLAVGTLTGGPVGAVIGAIAGGAAAGGLAGKGVGELIDPTTEDNWIREYMNESRTKVTTGGTATRTTTDATVDDAELDRYRPAFKYGVSASQKYGTSGRRFEEVEADLRSDWEREHGKSTGLKWDDARGAARHAYDRTLKLHEEHLRADKESVKTGDVNVRKEVITEHKQITVPVEREEVVIERRAVSGGAVRGDIKAEEIRIPVSEERVNVSKETVVKEEVTVGKRKVQGTETVEGDVRREEVRVDQTGSARVVDDKNKR